MRDVRDARDKWNRIYEKKSEPGSVAAVLNNHADLLPNSGRALDIACGTGGNALFLAERGLEVDAWDISNVVVSTLADRHTRIHPKALDVTADALGTSEYDVILTCHYLDPSLAASIREATKPGGLIIYQTFTASKKSDVGPSNPAFLLKPGQLESFVSGCEILVHEDGSDITDTNHPLAGRACIIARKPDA